MSALVDFLLARIAEDEAAVAAILRRDPNWDADGDGVFDRPDRRIAYVRGDYAAAHIARWDPTRVLAECEAKRRTVELHQPGHSEGAWTCDEDNYSWPCRTMRLLALPYADHPDSP